MLWAKMCILGVSMILLYLVIQFEVVSLLKGLTTIRIIVFQNMNGCQLTNKWYLFMLTQLSQHLLDDAGGNLKFSEFIAYVW